jgi:hypothetical protein
MRLPVPGPDVIYRAVNDGAVLLSMSDEVYYGLNEVGSVVWEHLPPICETFEELYATIARRYPDVPLKTIRTDVRELINDLLRHGLVGAGSPSTHAAKAPRAATSRLG